MGDLIDAFSDCESRKFGSISGLGYRTGNRIRNTKVLRKCLEECLSLLEICRNPPYQENAVDKSLASDRKYRFAKLEV